MDYDSDLSDVDQESEYVEALDEDPDFGNIQREIDSYFEIVSAQDKHEEEIERLLKDHLSVHEIKSYKKGLIWMLYFQI